MSEEGAAELPPVAPRSTGSRRRSQRRRLRRIRRTGYVLVVAGVLVLALLVDVVLRAHSAAGDLSAARKQLVTLRRQATDLTTGSPQRQATLLDVQSDTQAARDQAHSAEWRLLSHVPGLGPDLRAVGSLIDTVDSVTHDALPALLDVGTQLLDAADSDRATALQALDGQAAHITAVATTLAREITAVQDLHSGLHLPQVANARQQVLSELGDVAQQVHGLELAATIAPELLGAHGTRHVLVVLQQPAESRATGGLVGGVVLLEVKDGHATVKTITPKLPVSTTDVIKVTQEYSEHYGSEQPLKRGSASNLSPDFPVVGATWAGLWATKHDKVDAVVGMTPQLLDLVLAATGPVKLGDGTTLKAGQVSQLTSVGLYKKFPLPSDEDRRNAYQDDLLSAVVTALLHSPASLRQLQRPLSTAVGTGDLRLWAAKADLEAQLRTTVLGGAVPDDPGPFLGVITQNIGGTKLDAYLQRTISYSRSNKGATDDVTTTVALDNTAPAKGLPPYVTYRIDLPHPQDHPGQNLESVAVYLATDATAPTLTVDGQPADVSIAHEHGHLVLTTTLTLDPGQTRTVVVHATEAHSDDPPVLLRQATIRPDVLHLS